MFIFKVKIIISKITYILITYSINFKMIPDILIFKRNSIQTLKIHKDLCSFIKAESYRFDN